MSDSGKKKGIVTLSSLAKSEATSDPASTSRPRGLYGSSMAQSMAYRDLCSATRSGGAGTGSSLWKRIVAMGTDDEHGQRYDALQGETEEKSRRRVEAEGRKIKRKPGRTEGDSCLDSDTQDSGSDSDFEKDLKKYEVLIPVSLLTGKKQGQTLGGSSLKKDEAKEKRLAYLGAKVRIEKYGKENPWLDTSESPGFKSSEKEKSEIGVSPPEGTAPQDSGNLYD